MSDVSVTVESVTAEEAGEPGLQEVMSDASELYTIPVTVNDIEESDVIDGVCGLRCVDMCVVSSVWTCGRSQVCGHVCALRGADMCVECGHVKN